MSKWYGSCPSVESVFSSRQPLFICPIMVYGCHNTVLENVIKNGVVKIGQFLHLQLYDFHHNN